MIWTDEHTAQRFSSGRYVLSLKADLRSGRGRTASSRAYGGHAVPFRAYGGRAASLSPTAFPTKANRYSSCFPLPRGSSTEASELLYKNRKRENPPFPHHIWKTAADARRPSRLRRAGSAFSRLRRTRSVSRAYGVPYESKPQGFCLPLHRGSTKEPSPGSFPRAGPSLFIEKIPSLLFCYLRLHNRTHSVFLAYGVCYASKPQSVCFALHVGSSTKALTQSSLHSA